MIDRIERLDVRSRRLKPTNHSYQPGNSGVEELKTSRRSCSPLPSFTSRWRIMRDDARFLQRCAMRFAEIAIIAVAMFLLPTIIQCFVHRVDEIYEVMGRRARSKFDFVSWWHVLVGLVLLLAWHYWLVRLSVVAIMDGRRGGDRENGTNNEDATKDGTKGMMWRRLLGRVLLPLYLILSGSMLFIDFIRRLLGSDLTASPSTMHPDDSDKPVMHDHW